MAPLAAPHGVFFSPRLQGSHLDRETASRPTAHLGPGHRASLAPVWSPAEPPQKSQVSENPVRTSEQRWIRKAGGAGFLEALQRHAQAHTHWNLSDRFSKLGQPGWSVARRGNTGLSQPRWHPYSCLLAASISESPSPFCTPVTPRYLCLEPQYIKLPQGAYEKQGVPGELTAQWPSSSEAREKEGFLSISNPLKPLCLYSPRADAKRRNDSAYDIDSEQSSCDDCY